MRSMRYLILFLICLACTAPLPAQRHEREPLTAAQIDKIRESGIDPSSRVKLYTQFVDEHVETIKALAVRKHSSAWAHRMDEELLDLTALMDELGSNLDVFSDRKADVRKSLKPLAEATQRWLSTLRALPTAPPFDLSRKDAIAGAEDVAEQATQMLKEQTEYFNLHKDQRGQDRVEPD